MMLTTDGQCALDTVSSSFTTAKVRTLKTHKVPDPKGPVSLKSHEDHGVLSN